MENHCQFCNYNSCPLQSLKQAGQISPEIVAGVMRENGVIGDTMTRQVMSTNSWLPSRRVTVNLYGDRDPEKTNQVINPRKAVIECTPEGRPSLGGIIMAAIRRQDLDAVYRKVTWSSEKEAMHDFYGSLNNLISLSLFNHFSNIDSERVEWFDISLLYDPVVYKDRVNPLFIASNTVDVLRLLGKAYATALSKTYAISLFELITSTKDWMKADFLLKNLQIAVDGCREGYQRANTNGPKHTVDNVGELITGGAGNAFRNLSAMESLKLLYPNINPLQIGKNMAGLNFNHLQDFSTILLDQFHESVGDMVPGIPILSKTKGNLDISNMSDYKKGSYVCPAGHKRSDECNKFMHRLLYRHPEKSYPLTNKYVNSGSDSITTFANFIPEHYGTFLAAWQSIDPQVMNVMNRIGLKISL